MMALITVPEGFHDVVFLLLTFANLITALQCRILYATEVTNKPKP
ncbi:MAG: hypothetical protein UZ21_OP11001001021 [Microgenomates bacterium OLB22]|nr:MAG: hypothetical protein UZ21_OP11001001021 [Microgenomates bacterium OLB22]